MKNNLIVYAFAVLLCLSSCSEKKSTEYKPTDLPFETIGLTINKDGGYSTSVEYKDGVKNVSKPICTKITIQGLKLKGIDILLKSNNITSDCMIETKDYGNLMISSSNSLSFNILVTQEQEELFKKLRSK